MLTVLTVKDYSNKKRGLDWFKRDNTQLEVIKYNKIQIVHIIYNKYGKKVKWDKIRQLAGNEAERLLCNESIVFPESSGLKRYRSNLLKERVAENTTLEVLKRCSEQSDNLEIGVYDSSGKKSAFVRELLKYVDRLTVVTDAVEDYYKIYKQIISETGAVILIKNDVSALKSCNVVVAPEKIKKQIPVRENTVVFTATNPAVCQTGRVYSGYIVVLNESYKDIKPYSLSDEYFAQALYDKGRQYRLGSVLPILCISESGNATIEEISAFVQQHCKIS
ncbi:MAG: hypothetical protein UH241_05635 [Acutalibacteraceae bacterium]|nr:hypothetical protein [Acutalibacteraceae bacterium]